MLLLDLRQELLSARRMAQEAHGGFRERPLQMDIAHLGAAAPQGLAGGRVGALHQARIRRTFVHPIKAGDVVDLIENRQRQHLADARDGSQTVERVAVMPLGVPHDRQLEVGDEIVVALE